MSTIDLSTSNSSVSPAEYSSNTRCRLSRYRQLPPVFKITFLLVSVASVIPFVLHWFSIPVFGYVFAGTTYYYLIYALKPGAGLAAGDMQRCCSFPYCIR